MSASQLTERISDVRDSDSKYPLSYLYHEYADKVIAKCKTPITFEAWVRDDAHAPTFRARADVLASADQETREEVK